MKIFNRYGDFVNALNIGNEVLQIQKDFNLSLTEYTDWDLELKLKEEIDLYDKVELTFLSNGTKITSLSSKTYYFDFEIDAFDETMINENTAQIIDGALFPIAIDDTVPSFFGTTANPFFIQAGEQTINFTLTENDIFSGATDEQFVKIYLRSPAGASDVYIFSGTTAGEYSFEFEAADTLWFVVETQNMGLADISFGITNPGKNIFFNQENKNELIIKLDKIETKPFIPGNLLLSVGFLKKGKRNENIYRVGSVFKSYSQRNSGFPL